MGTIFPVVLQLRGSFFEVLLEFCYW